MEPKRQRYADSLTAVPLQSVDEAPRQRKFVADSIPTVPLQSGEEATTSAAPELSSRGLARGVVDVRLKAKIPCVIFGEAYPSWIAFASQLGYEPVMVVLRSDRYLGVVEDSVPDKCVVWVGEWSALIAKVPHFVDREAIAFVDGRVTQQVLDLSEAMDIQVVVGTDRSRREIKGWTQVSKRVNHADVGGVTHSITHVVACTKGATAVPLPRLPAFIPRDVSSVLSDTVGKGAPRAPPRSRKLPPCSVINVRPGPEEKHPVYHGKGWLPPYPGRRTLVLTPSVYAPKTKWMLRGLTASEYLAVYDCPDRLLSVLKPVVEDRAFPRLRPGKALLAGTCAALQELHNGGGISFPIGKKRSSAQVYESEAGQTFGLTIDRVKNAGQTIGLTIDVSKDAGQAFSLTNDMSNFKKLRPTRAGGPIRPILSHQELPPEQAATLSEIDQEKRERKATKSDDAKVPEYIWTQHYIEESSYDWKPEDKTSIEKAMKTMRKWLLRRWKRRVFYSYMKYFYESGNRPRGPSTKLWLTTHVHNGRIRYDWTCDGRSRYQEWHRQRVALHQLEIVPGADAVVRAWKSSWWEWEDGSRPFHWRWPEWYRKTIRDGLEVHLEGKPPVYRVPQKDEKDPVVKEAVKKKLSKVRIRRYIEKGIVVSLTSFFSVPKGEDDIRMVYDGTKSGLNECMWVPRFGLPTIETHLRSIEEGTFLADVDVGDCFLNFPLHRSLRRLAGVDLTHYFPSPDGSIVWECWTRALMGCKSSPYQAVQGMTVAEEVIRGDPGKKDNVFHWDYVRLNCPGDPDYDPSLPWVSKTRKDGYIAADLVGYVDDLRTSGSNRKEAWKAARRTASILNYLGLQDAPRKRRDSTRRPGAWSGAVVVTKDDGVYVTSDSEKWSKAKAMVEEVIGLIEEDAKRLKRKRLEQVRGFLNYVVRTYPPLKPYLTGLHLTIDGWRPDRDQEGWRKKRKSYVKAQKDEEVNWDWAEYDETGLYDEVRTPTLEVPVEVEAKERLGADMAALRYLMANPKPLPRRVRSVAGRKVIYCYGDASSSGFGFTLEIDGTLYYEYGQWGSVADDESSNWREATNLLESLRRAIEDHQLHGLELFIFTDNTTAESTFWKGWSKSRSLSGIVLELRKLEMEFDLILHIIHVSGTRMIRQGTDGLSRADHSNGVMNGEDMASHVPLNLSAVERSPQLKNKFMACAKELNIELLEPHEWFDEYHRFGNFIWSPPPAAAEAVVDLLNKARHKRPESMHIVLVPRLMTGRWRRMLTRTADFYFKIDWKDSWDLRNGSDCLMTWVEYCCNPRCEKRLTPRNGIFCGNFSFGRGPYAPCRSAFCPGCLVPLGEKPFKVRETLDDDGEPLPDKEPNRFMKARAGDPFMTPYQCELCHFRNIQKRNPFPGDSKDEEILEFCRRASLDAFWARETSTVSKNLSLVNRANSFYARLNLPSAMSTLGPYPLEDTFGMLTAITVLDKSLDTGKYEEFVQWETFRKMRSAVTNFHQASATGMNEVIAAHERSRLWVSKVPTHTFWFTRFMDGLHKRVGEVVRQDWPIPIEVLRYIDKALNRLWNDTTDVASRKKIAEMGAWFIVGFCTGLRGEEMILIELAGTAASLRFLSELSDPHFLVRIKGRTKNYHISGAGFEIPCVAETGVTHLKPGRWIRRLVELIHAEGRTNGKLFRRSLEVPKLYEFEEDFFDILEGVQNATDLIDSQVDLRDKAGILRSIRRGLTSHTVNLQIDKTLTSAINRWRAEFKSDGNQVPGYQMVDRYAQLDTLKPAFLRFSKAL